jgi:hypothetical protein
LEGVRDAAAALAALLGGLARCMKCLEDLDDAVVQLHDSSSNAVPLNERQRAPRVPRGEVVYSGGRMCVVEHQPQHSHTFVVSVAVQTLSDKRLRLHAVITYERWLQSGNERRELWRGRLEASASEDGATTAEELVAELQRHLPEAISAFDSSRRSP